MTTIAVGATVRLVPEACALQSDLAGLVGRVVEVMDGAVCVNWPGLTAWHRVADLEPVS